uniref:Cleavage and polyadenylation specificity factor subunit 3 (Trinotate prediction) n=1 Tax=Myxobolus squamalis TaxID=59785 RepID=A0A6B2FVZ4_MYXSQ
MLNWYRKKTEFLDYISFSAHADYNQFKELVEGLLPPIIVLVHGEANEMNRLKTSLLRDLSEKNILEIQIYTPKNTCSLELKFKGEMLAKVYGKLISEDQIKEQPMSGIIIKSGFSYKILSIDEIEKYSELKLTTINQRLEIPFYDDANYLQILFRNLSLLTGNTLDNLFTQDSELCLMLDEIELAIRGNKIILTWGSSLTNDATADAIVAVIMETNKSIENNIEKNIGILPQDDHHYYGLVELLKKNFGNNNVIQLEDKTIVVAFADTKKAIIDPSNRFVVCDVVDTKEKIDRTLFHYFNAIEPFCNCKFYFCFNFFSFAFLDHWFVNKFEEF